MRSCEISGEGAKPITAVYALGFVASPLRFVGGEGGGEVAPSEFVAVRRSRELGAEIFVGGSSLVSSVVFGGFVGAANTL